MPDCGAAIVTGAGRGIGRAIAVALQNAGFSVARVSIEEEPPDQHGLNGSPYYRLDIADIQSHERLISEVGSRLGAITCLVNNAGVSSLVRGDMVDLSPQSFDRSVAVNLRGTFFLTQAIARYFLQSPPGTRFRSIVTISSANAEIVGVNRADYCMTKAALAMMNKLFASRLAEAGIGVFEVRPGIIQTDMTKPAFDRYESYIQEGGVPLRRWGTVEDVAKAVTTLAQGNIPFATGIHVDVGGGLQLHRV